MNADTRCGYIAIVGAPNAGKSTLLNQAVGTKLAIVTPKAQTTRNRILGITLRGAAQLVFIDTPGIFDAKAKFEKAMVASALSGAADADIVLFLLDAERGLNAAAENVLDRIKHMKGRKYLVLNKIDQVPKERLLELTQAVFPRADFVECFMISAKTGDGVDGALAHLAEAVPAGPWLFPEDQLTDLPQRSLAAEITREKLFLQLSEELPYSLAVETEEWLEKRDGSVKISQVIFVRSEGQKKIVIGEGGERLKKIGQSARIEMEKLQERRVHLFLFVKIDENWKEKPDFYSSIGLEYKK